MCAGPVTDFATHIGMRRSYHLIMALHPERDPIDEEIDRVLADNPGLREELKEWDRRFAAGEVKDDEFVTTDEVRRRLGMSAPPA